MTSPRLDKLAASTRTEAKADLIEALTKAAAQFRQYERIHLAKDTPEAKAKAFRNAEIARLCERALARHNAAKEAETDDIARATGEKP